MSRKREREAPVLKPSMMAFRQLLRQACLLGFAIILGTAHATAADNVPIPKIEGPWWQVTGIPDLKEYNSPGQQSVDFAIWKASDGTWQIWSCIRLTKVGGH